MRSLFRCSSYTWVIATHHILLMLCCTSTSSLSKRTCLRDHTSHPRSSRFIWITRNNTCLRLQKHAYYVDKKKVRVHTTVDPILSAYGFLCCHACLNSNLRILDLIHLSVIPPSTRHLHKKNYLSNLRCGCPGISSK